MYPTIFKFGKFALHTYGLCIAIAFLTGIMLAKREASRLGEDPEKIMDLSFYILLSAIIGSRIFYVLTNLRFFLYNPIDIFKIWEGGLVFYGGFIGAVIVSAIYLKYYHIPFWKTADIFSPSLAIGHAIGRIGCFFAGCCYGKECALPWAITFHNADSLAPQDISLHPTQLYSSLNNLIIFLILISVKKYKKFDGQIFLVYLFLYGIGRSTVEFFRNDFRGGKVFGVLSISQAIGLSLSLIAILTIVIHFTYLKKNNDSKQS
ncbi:MAG: prolipoprotein diacylglyceryl transferase [Desulfobacterales bacterium]|nr:prolipoprotein diacylglyceryl transferase [Desulfobacterales bacterium]